MRSFLHAFVWFSRLHGTPDPASPPPRDGPDSSRGNGKRREPSEDYEARDARSGGQSWHFALQEPPLQAFQPGDLAFPQISAPCARPSPPVSTLLGNTPVGLGPAREKTGAQTHPNCSLRIDLWEACGGRAMRGAPCARPIAPCLSPSGNTPVGLGPAREKRELGLGPKNWIFK